MEINGLWKTKNKTMERKEDTELKSQGFRKDINILHWNQQKWWRISASMSDKDKGAKIFKEGVYIQKNWNISKYY